MANTTNFGWETPDDTDLVKDGAAAMRTLGNAIDASFVDLKGGTTGQVLSKATNTDLDFTWVTQDDANAIQNAIVDAKGDLITATAADTPARLAVGANNTVLTADSSTATGLKWATPATGVTFTLAASGSLSGNKVNVTGLSGTFILYSVANASHDVTNSDIYVGFNDNATIMRFTSTAVYSRYAFASSATGASQNSTGGIVFAANSSAPQKPVFLGQNGSNQYTLSTTSAITAVTFSLESGANFDGGTYEIWTA